MRPPLSYVPLLPVLLLLIAAILVIHYFIPRNYPPLDKEARTYHGMVEEISENNSGQHLTVSVKELHPYKARITVPSVSKEFLPGDSVVFHSKLTEFEVLDRYCNNFKANFLLRGIYAQSFVTPDSISVTTVSQNAYWKIKRLRPKLSHLIKETPLSSGTIEFLCAAIIGDNSLILDSTRDIFSGAGVSHVLALSGLHVGIITLLITLLLFPLYILRQRKLLIGVVITLLWFYAVLTGLSPSVTRAVIMATTVGVGVLLQRRNFSFNALLLAAIIILFLDPNALFNVGFQLSFCSVACILLTVPIIYRLKLHPGIRYIATLILVTAAATLGSGLIAAYYFHSFPIFFILANVPVLLVLPVLMGVGLLVVLLQLFTTSPHWVCDIADGLYNIIINYVETVTSIPHATIDHIFFSPWVFISYILFIAMLFTAIHYRKRSMAYSALGIGIVTIVVALISSEPLNAEEYFIVPSFRDTTILHRRHNKVVLYTTAQPRNALNIKDKVNANYSEYIKKHKVDSIDIIPAREGIVTFSDKRILLLHTNDTAAFCNKDISHVIICRGFSGNPLQIPKQFPSSCIILSRDLHPKRHNRYLDSLNKYNIPVHSLRTHFDADIFNAESK